MVTKKLRRPRIGVCSPIEMCYEYEDEDRRTGKPVSLGINRAGVAIFPLQTFLAGRRKTTLFEAGGLARPSFCSLADALQATYDGKKPQSDRTHPGRLIQLPFTQFSFQLSVGPQVPQIGRSRPTARVSCITGSLIRTHIYTHNLYPITFRLFLPLHNPDDSIFHSLKYLPFSVKLDGFTISENLDILYMNYSQ